MNKVVFLDRDGVINFEPGTYTFRVDEFNIVDGLFEVFFGSLGLFTQWE